MRLTRVSAKIVSQECPQERTASVSNKGVPQNPTRVSGRGVAQECQANVSHKGVLKDPISVSQCHLRMSVKSVSDEGQVGPVRMSIGLLVFSYMCAFGLMCSIFFSLKIYCLLFPNSANLPLRSSIWGPSSTGICDLSSSSVGYRDP